MGQQAPPNSGRQPRTLAASRRATTMALLLLAAGCTTIGQRNIPTPAAQQAAMTRSYHRDIDISGRLSVRYQQNGQEQAVHGNFNWTQAGERTKLALFSPLGQTLATIEVTPQRSTLIQAGRPPRIAADADALAAEALGWPLPLSGLHDWLQGFARGANGMRIVATPLQDEITTGDGWHLRFVSWQDNGNASAPYPRRIDLARSTAQAGDVALRIVIDQWQPR
jgi:outer membrane lipoprotein LolB